MRIKIKHWHIITSNVKYQPLINLIDINWRFYYQDSIVKFGITLSWVPANAHQWRKRLRWRWNGVGRSFLFESAVTIRLGSSSVVFVNPQMSSRNVKNFSTLKSWLLSFQMIQLFSLFYLLNLLSRWLWLGDSSFLYFLLIELNFVFNELKNW